MAMPELAFCDVLICCYTAVGLGYIFLYPTISGKVMVYLYEILTRFGPERSRENERIALAIF